MSEKPKKKLRISVTIPIRLLADLNTLVEEGLYLNRGEIILDAFRHFLDEHYYLKSITTREPPELEETEPEEIDKEEAAPKLES